MTRSTSPGQGRAVPLCYPAKRRCPFSTKHEHGTLEACPNALFDIPLAPPLPLCEVATRLPPPKRGFVAREGAQSGAWGFFSSTGLQMVTATLLGRSTRSPNM